MIRWLLAACLFLFPAGFANADLSGNSISVVTSYSNSYPYPAAGGQPGGTARNDNLGFKWKVYFSETGKIYFSFGNATGHVINNPGGGTVDLGSRGTGASRVVSTPLTIRRRGENVTLSYAANVASGTTHTATVKLVVNGNSCRVVSFQPKWVYVYNNPYSRSVAKIFNKKASCRLIIGRSL